jgi:cytochrome c oxidase assembly protein subunit 11
MATKNKSLAVNLAMLVVGMLLLSFASVPLYRIFCEVTGFGGTTENASSAPSSIGTRKMSVEFNTDVAPELNLKFSSLQKNISLKPGEQKLALFSATNKSSASVSGTAVFNVTPHKAGSYFVKIKCFCYDEMVLAPGQTVNLPVSFFIAPEIENDSEMADIHTITLSYTFFKTKYPKTKVPDSKLP